MGRRTLGIGVINFAYYLAKNGVRYSDGSANNLTHRTFEAIQYYLLKASNALAREQGACPWFNETTYSQGILPIDTYKKDLDAISNEPLHYDWETLRKEIQTHGLRNSTLSALMPSETSSQTPMRPTVLNHRGVTSASKPLKMVFCVRSCLNMNA